MYLEEVSWYNDDSIREIKKMAKRKSSTKAIMDSLAEQGAFFGVREEAVKTGRGRVIQGKKCIVREDDGHPLGIVSKGYPVTTNHAIFDRFAQALSRSRINTDGATAEVKFANNGARMMGIIHFPAHEIKVGEGDSSILRVVTRNSYDGRWKFSIQGGALRMACLNGMLLGDWLAGYSEYHNAKLDLDHAAEKVGAIVSGFLDTKKQWTQFLRKGVTDETAWRVICLYANRMEDFKRGIAAFRDEKARRTTATTMFEQYESKEKKELGSNAFAVLNTLTHHATHAKQGEGKAAISADLRQRRVEAVLASKYWRERVVGSETRKSA